MICPIRGECAESTCGDIDFAGCCHGLQLRWCQGGRIQTLMCFETCGWSADNPYYVCGGSGPDPSGERPITCPGDAPPDPGPELVEEVPEEASSPETVVAEPQADTFDTGSTQDVPAAEPTQDVPAAEPTQD